MEGLGTQGHMATEGQYWLSAQVCLTLRSMFFLLSSSPASISKSEGLGLGISREGRKIFLV